MAETDDIALLKQFAETDSEPAFDGIVSRHLNLVYSTALRSAGDAYAAQEISQAVFIILARKAKSLGAKTILSGWLHRTTRLTAANYVRGEIRRQKREQEAFMQSTLNETADETWRQIAPVLDDAISKLGAKDRDAIVLRFFENKSLGEVGAALGASEDAAKMRVNRALEKLRKFFTKRGVTFSAAAIAGAVSANSVQAAPVGLAQTISAVAIAKGAASGGTTLALAKGALKIMAWTKMKTAIVTTAVVILTAGTATIAVKHYNHSPNKLPMTPANMALFRQESSSLENEVKWATLYCMMFASDHQNQLPKSFAQLNAAKLRRFITQTNNIDTLQTKLSDANWEFTASGDKNSFTNPDTTIYFLEKEPRESPDGQFVRVYATVNGRVLLLTSSNEDFTAAERQRGFLIGRVKN